MRKVLLPIIIASILTAGSIFLYYKNYQVLVDGTELSLGNSLYKIVKCEIGDECSFNRPQAASRYVALISDEKNVFPGTAQRTGKYFRPLTNNNFVTQPLCRTPGFSGISNCSIVYINYLSSNKIITMIGEHYPIISRSLSVESLKTANEVFYAAKVNKDKTYIYEISRIIGSDIKISNNARIRIAAKIAAMTEEENDVYN